jgi:hypothetical protein
MWLIALRVAVRVAVVGVGVSFVVPIPVMAVAASTERVRIGMLGSGGARIDAQNQRALGKLTENRNVYCALHRCIQCIGVAGNVCVLSVLAGGGGVDAEIAR